MRTGVHTAFSSVAAPPGMSAHSYVIYKQG